MRAREARAVHALEGLADQLRGQGTAARGRAEAAAVVGLVVVLVLVLLLSEPPRSVCIGGN
jgi:hypothetical protein